MWGFEAHKRAQNSVTVKEASAKASVAVPLLTDLILLSVDLSCLAHSLTVGWFGLYVRAWFKGSGSLMMIKLDLINTGIFGKCRGK